MFQFDKSPIAVYLTWEGDPTTTITIQWLSMPDETSNLVKYHSLNDFIPLHAVATTQFLPQDVPYLLHRVQLTNLKPGTEYSFQIEDLHTTYKFQTLPLTLTDPLRFVVGGDIYHNSLESVRETNLQAAQTNPAFALLGGDLAYSTDKVKRKEDVHRWFAWLNLWTQTMITPAGCLIPIVATLGNHDTCGRFGKTPDYAEFFYALFKTPCNQGYRTFDAGRYLAITLLDSGHTHPIHGIQTRWLHKVLAYRQSYLHKFAIYHVPAYPSTRHFNAAKSPFIRRYWVPLFEKYHLDAAFENHDHNYKRTVPILNGKEHPNGVLYLGDGSWGVDHETRPKTSNQAWYLAKTVPIRHFILVTLNGHQRAFEAINYKGEIFDSYTETVHTESPLLPLSRF
ncbi:MAG: fibronectin type III domain-containing protein [Parachlamydiaceae bacterium]